MVRFCMHTEILFVHVDQCTTRTDGEVSYDHSYYNVNGVARTLKKYAQQRETTASSNDSLQLRPFSKWELLLRKEFAPRGS